MTDRKLRKYLKFIQKDMAKACNTKRKELFGKNVPKCGASIAISYYKEFEKERIKQAREWFESDFKEKYPEYKDLTIKWEDSE